MPFVGQLGGNYVLPHQVSTSTTVQCAECGGTMEVRKGHYNKGSKSRVSRHFRHKQGEGEGCGGESAIHLKMKVLAESTLEEKFPNANVQQEKQVGENNIADVLATFENPRIPFGKGIIVEAQHKNKGKNIGHVGNKYLDLGYSVFWAYQSDFNETKMKFDEERLWKVWPEAVPEFNPEEAYPDFKDIPIEKEIKLPKEYLRTRIIEIISPTFSKGAKKWSKVAKQDIHSKGKERFRVNILEAPTGATTLEWSTKEGRNGQRKTIPTVISENDESSLREYIQEIQDGLSQSWAYEDSSDWINIGSVRLTGTKRTTPRISLAKAPHGPLLHQIRRRDSKGNMSSLTVDYRKGDENRLEKAVNKIF